MLEFTKIDCLDDVEDEVLHYRAKRARSGRSTGFVVKVDGVEHGFLAYDDWSEKSEGFIYEVFVLPGCRKRGLGAKMLSYAEDVAIKLGCKCIRLEPRSLDSEIDINWLVSWYEAKGYVEKSSDGVMEKNLASTLTPDF